MEIYSSSGSRTFMTSNQIRKLKKQMKKSFKKADNLKKKLEKIKNLEEKEADFFLSNQLDKI